LYDVFQKLTTREVSSINRSTARWPAWPKSVDKPARGSINN
jgi:hypothetical protein